MAHRSIDGQIRIEVRGGIGAFTQCMAAIIQNALSHSRRHIFMARFLAARHELPTRDRKHGGGRRFEECLAVLHILETALFIDTSLLFGRQGISQETRNLVSNGPEIPLHRFEMNEKDIVAALRPSPPPIDVPGPRQPIHAVAAEPIRQCAHRREERANQQAIEIYDAGEAAHRMPGNVDVLGAWAIGAENSGQVGLDDPCRLLTDEGRILK